MKYYLTVAFMLFFSISVASQTTTDAQIEQVQTVTGSLIGKKVIADVLLRDFNEMTGYVVSLGQDVFEMNTDRKKSAGVRIRYDNVLVISSKKASVSFIPHPKTSPYGNWSDLRKIPPMTFFEVTQKNGEVKAGHYLSSADDTLVLRQKDKNLEFSLSRADIAFVHRLKAGWRDLPDHVAGATNKGAEVGGALGNGNSGEAFAALLGAGIGAGIGAIKGAFDKHDPGLKVLIFSQ